MASSMQEYLKRYASEAVKPKKKKRRKHGNVSKGASALTIVDADPVWQKEIKEASSESEAEQGDAPLVIEDVEFKRMQRLEALRMRPYIATADDGSGWVSLNETLVQGSLEKSIAFATFPNQKEHAQGVPPERTAAEHDNVGPTFQSTEREVVKRRNDIPEGDFGDNNAQHDDEDLSPLRKERNSEKRRHDTPERDSSPPRHLASAEGGYHSPRSSPRRKGKHVDLSPPRKRQTSSVRDHHGFPEPNPSRTGKVTDLSPPRRTQTSSVRSGRHDSPDLSPRRTGKNVDLSPPRQRKTSLKLDNRGSPDSSPPRRRRNADFSPPRQKQTSLRSGYRGSSEMNSPPRTADNLDLSPPRRRQASSKKAHHTSSESSPSRVGENVDLSPPRRRLLSAGKGHRDSSSPPKTGKSLVLSPPKKSQLSSRMLEHDEDNTDFSPRRKLVHNELDSRGFQKLKRKEIMADGTAAGLHLGKQLEKEAQKKKNDDSARLKEVDVSLSGRHANTVYRDKHGKRLEGVDDILKLQQAEEPKKEKPLEWGRGLVQKREAEAKYAELESEKNKPFARSRDDPDLDKALKEQIRWGDPMAHLVKKRGGEPVLVDLGANELMKESGFIIPQSVPNHSWLKRGVTALPNRYGIKPGRHWDGVDRSTGYEREMFKRQNEKEADRLEAYLWSVADM